jgi:hypothetical protein
MTEATGAEEVMPVESSTSIALCRGSTTLGTGAVGRPKAPPHVLADVEVELFGAEEVKSWSGTVFLKPGDLLHQRAYRVILNDGRAGEIVVTAGTGSVTDHTAAPIVGTGALRRD